MVGRGAFITTLAFVLACSITPFAQQPAEPTEDQREAFENEAEEIQKLPDGALAKQVGPNDFNLAWVHQHFLRSPAGEGRQFVPFTLSLDPKQVPGGMMTLYWRIVPPAATAKPGAKPETQKPVAEGASLVTAGAAASPMLLSRSFTVPAGTYDVYVVAKELQVDPPRNAPEPKTVVIKQELEVPDFWGPDMTASSVIAFERVEPLAAPLTPQQQFERPYAMGTAEIVPFSSMRLTKAQELSWLLFIYNPQGDSAGKPDIAIDYNFCQVVPGNKPEGEDPCRPGEKFYNKKETDLLNAQTVDPNLDVKQHPVQSVQGVPVATFPAGDYRLEIKITDKLANKTIVKDVNFTVS